MTVTDLRMERILRRAGWPLRRFGCATAIDAAVAVAGYLDISHDSLEPIRRHRRLRGPVLWMQVVVAAASRPARVRATVRRQTSAARHAQRRVGKECVST